MSAQPTMPVTPPDQVNIEIDGKAMQVPKGSMIIHASDKAGIPVPRFCYHEKLPIAANCRMCLVDVEKSPKPVPACATPVMEGMKVYTQSKRALDSQRNVMEFLLINHPLDCPICDQGGECELQDVAMGYGRSVSRFNEGKRVVADEDIGALVATDMTRCIHCTRCVRFMSEVAGTYELGGMSRGENIEIGTYIGKSIETELGGNIIDVCPVGALTNKPFRFRARAWELTARESIGYHDALGSNLFLHTRRGEILRTVPRDNEKINECWLTDRDRYSFAGLYAEDRVKGPMIREGDHWRDMSWDEAITVAAEKLLHIKTQHGDNSVAGLFSPATTNEEGFLLTQLLRHLGSESFDYRLRTIDFADDPIAKPFEMSVAAIEKSTSILLVGSYLRHEMPLLNHRVRKAWKRGASVMAISPVDFALNLELTQRFIVSPHNMVYELASILKSATQLCGKSVETYLAAYLESAVVTDAHRDAAKRLLDSSASLIIFGEIAAQHPQASVLRALSRALAKISGSAFNEIPQGANAIGLSSVGAKGKLANLATTKAHHAYVLYGTEVPNDFAHSKSVLDSLKQAEFVIAFSAFANDTLKSTANLILPIGLLPEIEGSFTNVDAITQTLSAGCKLPEGARQGWRVLRALAQAFGIGQLEFNSFAEVREAAKQAIKIPEVKISNLATISVQDQPFTRIAITPIYAVDSVLRRSAPLQTTPIAMQSGVSLNVEDALRLGLGKDAIAKVSDGNISINLKVHVCHTVAKGAALIPSALNETALLAPMGASLMIEKV